MPLMPEPPTAEMFLLPGMVAPAEPLERRLQSRAPDPACPAPCPWRPTCRRVVRRALDGRPAEPPAPAATPLSILPPLPPGGGGRPAPGMRR